MRESIPRKLAQEIADKLFFPGPNAAANQLARLRWALDFAQRQPGTPEDRIALTLFPDGSVVGQSGSVLLLTEEETQQVRARILELLKGWVVKGYCKIEDMPSTVHIQNDKSGPSVVFNPFDDHAETTRAVLTTAFLLARDGHRVRICRAPARYGKPGEKCGRLFAGRLNQDYCSSQCRLRKGQRRTRTGRTKRRAHHGTL